MYCDVESDKSECPRGCKSCSLLRDIHVGDVANQRRIPYQEISINLLRIWIDFVTDFDQYRFSIIAVLDTTRGPIALRRLDLVFYKKNISIFSGKKRIIIEEEVDINYSALNIQ